MNKEIERKFILRDLPIEFIQDEEIQHILQYYYLVDGNWSRIRNIESNTRGVLYLHTIKTYIDNVCYETEEYYSYERYKQLMNDIENGVYESRFLSKTRYVYTTGIVADFDGVEKSIKWEFDVFDKIHLMIAEVEIPSLDYNLIIPKTLEKYIIYEVSNIKEFSNKNLSVIHKNKKTI